MNKKLKVIAIAALIVAAVMLFASCKPANNTQPADNTQTADNTQPAGTDATAENPTQAPTQEPVITDVPATEAPTEEPTPSSEPTAAPIAKGTNVAYNADVEVSSTTGIGHIQWGWSYEYINDGLIVDPDFPSYGWTSAVGVNFEEDHEEWVEFTLSKVTKIDTVKVYPTLGGSYCPVTFEIQISMDGKEYTTVAKVEDNDRAATGSEEPFVLEFEAAEARYVRFLATKLYGVPSSLGDGILCQLAEIEILAA